MSMRKRNPMPRHEEDFYRTPWECTRSLLRVEPVAGQVWEPACGDGMISRELALVPGIELRSTDLIDRGYGEVADFLEQREAFTGTIFTNPPYKLASQFALHSLAIGASKVVLLLRLSWLEGKKRKRQVFDKTPPSRVWVCSSRPTLWHGDDPAAQDTGGAISYAWFVWDIGRTSKTTELLWIPPRTK